MRAVLQNILAFNTHNITVDWEIFAVKMIHALNV